MTKTGNEFIAFVFKAPVVLKIFQTMHIQECGQEFGSCSGRHCHGEALFGSLQVFQVTVVWVVSAFRPSHNPTKLRPLDLVLSSRQEAKDDAISPEDLAEVPVETGNRACFSLSLHAKQERATIQFQMPTLVFALQTGYQFQCGMFDV